MRTSSRDPSRSLTFEDAVCIWPRIWQGEFQNRIAADYDVNPGRISEIKTGQKFHGSQSEAARRFGKPFGH
ncbi:hypothetical protein [Castellaniella sp.]|uniref:hypothetical protein n=1 Tax=Castellaniella sp. TaxID=1955812 RepID=UPI002AFF97FB|nr:hypothetical protein [Castellaniella sp.]